MIPELNYAPFVWSSYGVFAAVCAWQFLAPWIRRRRLIRQIREQLEEEQAARTVGRGTSRSQGGSTA
jgi:heme exporter protein CcmD